MVNSDDDFVFNDMSTGENYPGITIKYSFLTTLRNNKFDITVESMVCLPCQFKLGIKFLGNSSDSSRKKTLGKFSYLIMKCVLCVLIRTASLK